MTSDIKDQLFLHLSVASLARILDFNVVFCCCCFSVQTTKPCRISQFYIQQLHRRQQPLSLRQGHYSSLKTNNVDAISVFILSLFPYKDIIYLNSFLDFYILYYSYCLTKCSYACLIMLKHFLWVVKKYKIALN